MMKRIGIVGGGQLGRMLTTPALQMGFHVTVVDPTPDSPASQVGAQQIVGALTDEKAIKELAKSSDVVTFEIEHINADILQKLTGKGVVVHPSPTSLGIIKDKLLQNQFLKKHGIPVADFQEVTSAEDIKNLSKTFGYPLMLKSRFGGYDGRGNYLISNEKAIPEARKKLGEKNLYVEKFVPFKKELAVMVARGTDGTVKAYPTVETIHENNILHYVLAPAPISKALQKSAQDVAIKVVEKLNGAGVFGIEMFLTRDNKILVNEIAPRVHNSGHYTIEACMTSQFAQHIRAITGLPLGQTAMLTPAAVMVNMLGDRTGKVQVKGLADAIKIPGVFVHIYGKEETRPERKMGHITVVGKNLATCLRNAKKARGLISI